MVVVTSSTADMPTGSRRTSRVPRRPLVIAAKGGGGRRRFDGTASVGSTFDPYLEVSGEGRYPPGVLRGTAAMTPATTSAGSVTTASITDRLVHRCAGHTDPRIPCRRAPRSPSLRRRGGASNSNVAGDFISSGGLPRVDVPGSVPRTGRRCLRRARRSRCRCPWGRVHATRGSHGGTRGPDIHLDAASSVRCGTDLPV